MKRYHFRTLFVASLLLIDGGGLILAFQLAFWTRFFCGPFLKFFPAVKGVPSVALYHQKLWALLPIWLCVFGYLSLYKSSLLSAYDEFIQVLKALMLCALFTTAVTFAYRGGEYSRLVIGLWFIYGVVFVFLLREGGKAVFRRLMLSVQGPEHVLVIGRGKALEAIREMCEQQPFVRMFFLETYTELLALRELMRNRKISEILLIQGSLSSKSIMEIAGLSEAMNIECKIVPDLMEMRRGEIIVDASFGVPTFHIKPLSLYGTNYILKRGFDVIVSLCILTVSSLPFVVIAFLIRLDSSGSILFSQERMGLRGRKFKLYKFRTMVFDADMRMNDIKHLSERQGPVFKMRNDPRITRVGRWLRASSLDEMPQILNVLKGDMSLVGPRPQVLWEAAHYDETAKKRLRVMPGITGLWQVSGRAALSYEEMINLDIYYLENWSLGLDLKILIRTLPAVFAREGAY